MISAPPKNLSRFSTLILLSISLMLTPACKGCDSDKTEKSVTDSSPDMTTDSALSASHKRVRKRQGRKVEAPPARKRAATRPVKTSVKEEAEKQLKLEKRAKNTQALKARPASDGTRSRVAPETKPAPPRGSASQRPDQGAKDLKVRIQPLKISEIVRTDELVQVMNQANGMVEASMKGQDVTADYNHLRLVPVGNETDLGLVVQVWRDPTVPSARQRHDDFVESYPGAKTNQSVTRKTFFAQYGNRSYVGFLATGQRTNVVLTCSSAVCSPEQMHKAAVQIKSRLMRR